MLSVTDMDPRSLTSGGLYNETPRWLQGKGPRIYSGNCIKSASRGDPKTDWREGTEIKDAQCTTLQSPAIHEVYGFQTTVTTHLQIGVITHRR